MSEQGVLLHSFTASNLLAAFFFYITLHFVVSLIRAPKYPTTIPWVGYGKGWLASLKHLFLAFTRSREWLQEGYNTYNKKDQSYVLPNTFGMTKEIVIPRSQMQWMLEQPDSVLSTSEAHYEVLHGDYSFIHSGILKEPYHEHIIHKNLARNFNGLIPSLADEVEFNMAEYFGQDTKQWKKINVMKTFIDVVPRVTNRMLTGDLLCRNQKYLDICVAFTMDVVRNLLLFSFMPKAIKGVIGPIAALPAKYHFRQSTEITYPLIKERLENIRRKDAGENKEWEEPNDYVTWHIRTASAEGRQDMLTVERIAQSLMPLNFASIHTTAMTGHGVILDVLASDSKFGAIEALREEAERIWREEGNQWTKQGLSRMYKIDSAIRESMRYSSFATTISARKVIAPEGITNPTEGWHAPYGAFISCPLYGASHDPDLMDGPEVFDPFRFSREREAYEAKPAEEKDPKEALKMRATGMVTTSDRHFPFGHGRHACPGRFFVAHELKMIIAHLVMNYDIKPLEKRPQPSWVGRTMMPASDACIEVIRRETIV